jgi:hypothetical protein
MACSLLVDELPGSIGAVPGIAVQSLTLFDFSAKNHSQSSGMTDE